MRSRAYTHTTHPYGSTQSAARGYQSTTHSVPPDSRTYRRGVTHTCTRALTYAYYAPHTSAHYPLEDAEARHAPAGSTHVLRGPYAHKTNTDALEETTVSTGLHQRRFKNRRTIRLAGE